MPRPIRDIEIASALAVLLLAIGFYFGSEIDRLIIEVGPILFAPGLSGGMPNGKHEGELDG